MKNNFISFNLFKKHHLVNGMTIINPNQPHTTDYNIFSKNKSQIMENYQKLYSSIKWNGKIAYLKQIHSDKIIIVNDVNNTDYLGEGDALITNKNNVLLLIRTADCLPIFIYDMENQIIALIHSGWKGTKDKILSKTLLQMQSIYNSKMKNILLGIGAGIHKCCYTVNFDLLNAFKLTYNNNQLKQIFTKFENQYKLDLIEANLILAQNLGIPIENIEIMNFCTNCRNDLFFSYRHNKTNKRNVAFLGMRNEKN